MMVEHEELPTVSAAALAAFSEKKSAIIDRAVESALLRRDEVEHHGALASTVIRAGFNFTTKMLTAAMQVGEVALLENQLQWAKDRLRHDGVDPANIRSRFEIYAAVVAELLLPEHADEVNAYVQWLIDRQAALIDATD